MNPLPLSDLDVRIIGELARDGRLANNELAKRLGIPASTCHGRVRALEDAGVITGYRATIDLERADRGVQALISLRMHGHLRDQVNSASAGLRDIPGVQSVFLLGGDRDLVIHVACASVASLRAFIAEHLGSNPAFAQTNTQLIFEHARGQSPL